MKRALLFFCLSTMCTAACGPRVDLAKGVAVESVATGWANGGSLLPQPPGKHHLRLTVEYSCCGRHSGNDQAL